MHSKLKIPVGEFTSPSPASVNEDTPVSTVLEMMEAHGCRHVPVLFQNRVSGIISDRDIYRHRVAQADGECLQARDIMTREVYRVRERTNIDQVVFAMSDRKISSAIVEDRETNFIGIFTSTDALNALVEVVRGQYDDNIS